MSTDTKSVSANPTAAAAATAGGSGGSGGSNKVESTKLFINGEFVVSKSGSVVDVFDPSTGAVIARCSNASADEVDAAVKAARKAFDAEGANSWSETTGKSRAKYLRALADKIAANKPALAKLETLNCGKPYAEAAWDLDDVSGCFNYYAGLAEELDSKQSPAAGSDIKIGDARFTIQMRYEPVGVAACIIPWNYPLLMLAWKVAPAIAAGCTIVLKPSELTPLTAMEFAKLCVEVGLPAGVINIITGTGAITGNALINHTGIDKIAFTGSVPTGTTVALAGAKQLKPATLELGGKSPIIVFNDITDIEKAVEWIMFGCFWTNGQICSATSRLLVHESLAEQLLPRLIAETSKIVIGNPNAPENTERTGMLGPVVSLGQHTKILGMIAQSIKEGGKLLTGGRKPDGKLYTGGYYIQPTIIHCGDAKSGPNSIWTNEVFGPVLAVRTFKDEAEAIAMANDSEFGLAGAVLSADVARAQRVVKRLRCGIAWINCSQPAFVEAPWGGMKKSGVGRELGPWGLNAYLQPKQVTSYISNDPWAWYIKKDSKL